MTAPGHQGIHNLSMGLTLCINGCFGGADEAAPLPKALKPCKAKRRVSVGDPATRGRSCKWLILRSLDLEWGGTDARAGVGRGGRWHLRQGQPLAQDRPQER